MTRPLRLELEVGVYPVLNRGNYRGDLFRTEKARTTFLQCMEETFGETGWRVRAWCPMSSHSHLAIATPKANLVDGMQGLQGTFAKRFTQTPRPDSLACFMVQTAELDACGFQLFTEWTNQLTGIVYRMQLLACNLTPFLSFSAILREALQLTSTGTHDADRVAKTHQLHHG